MKRDAQVATVKIADVSRLERETPKTSFGISKGRSSSRPVDVDWAISARASTRPVPRWEKWARIEWQGEGEEWLDLIGSGPDESLYRLRLNRGEDGPYVIAVEMSASPSDRMSTRLLRRLGLGDPLSALDWALSHPAASGIADGAWSRRIRRPGRAGRPDIFYAQWAARYVAALEAAPAAPIKFLVSAEKAADRHVTESGVKAIINKARTVRKLLTDSEPGKPGGTLTPKAEKILRGD